MADLAKTTKITANQQVPSKLTPPKRGRWWKLGLFLLILLGGFGWFAPTIVAKTELRNQIPKLLFPEFTGTCKFGETSLSWNSPVSVKNFRALDDEGLPIVEIPQFTTTEPLWSLVLQPNRLGTLKFQNPVVHISLTDTDSSIERVAARFMSKSVEKSLHQSAPDQPPGTKPTDKQNQTFAIEIENGRIELSHAGRNCHSTFDEISARLDFENGGLTECKLVAGNPPQSSSETTGADWLITHFGSPTGEHAEKVASNVKHVVIRASQWKLDRFKPVLPRLISNADLDGALSADGMFDLTPTQAGTDWSWEGNVKIEKLVLAGLDAMKQDKLALDQVDFTGRAAATEGRLVLQDVKLKTDVSELNATGDFPLKHPAQHSTMEIAQFLFGDDDYHVDGRIDLQKLAAMLPQTLRIREGTEITSGDVKMQFVAANVDGVRKWTGLAGITGLNAVNKGKKIPWDKPIVARINAHRDQSTFVVDQLDCRSDFLQIQGNGTSVDAHFTAKGDLSKLVANVERFIDLGIDELSGQMNARGEIQQKANNRVLLTTEIVLDNFAYVVSQNGVWREPHLVITMNGVGQSDAQSTLTIINSGDLHLNSGVDQLDLVLQKPVDLTAAPRSYSTSANLKGTLATWQNRLRPFVTVQDWRFAGDVGVASKLTLEDQQTQFDQLAIQVRNFEAIGPEWLIDEPELKFDTIGKWDAKAKQWTSPKLNLTGKALSLEATDVEVGIGPQGLSSLMGTASYRAQLAQLCSWKNRAIKNPAYYLIGLMSGTASITRQDNFLTGNLDAIIDKFKIAGQGTAPTGQPQWVTLWDEPQCKLAGKGSYDLAADRLKLDTSNLSVQGLSIGASGKLDNVSTNRRIDLAGDLAYDWSILSQRFSPDLAAQIQIAGKGQRPFSINGSLVAATNNSSVSKRTKDPFTTVLPVSNSTPGKNNSQSSGGLVDLNGQAGVGWDSLAAYGFTTGAGDVSTQIARGVCTFAPLDMTVNGGKLHLAPTIFLDRDPYILSLAKGRLVDQLNLTPELCHNSLKFVAPILAEATQIDGTMTVDLESAALPLVAPGTGSASGVLSIQKVQAKPGPLSLQLVGAINQVRSILTRQPNGPASDQVLVELSEQQVPFKLERGRFYHQGMTFNIANIAVKTSGSVGIDNTLDLIAEIPFKDEWLGNGRVLAGMKGKSIQIPISGTTAFPRIDPGTFADLARQIGGAALDGLLDDKVNDGLKDVINNGLDQLLRGRR